MSSVDTITLVVVSDDHYMILVAALIKSIEKNLSTNVKIDFWIIEDGVGENQKEKMKASIDPRITSLYWKDINDVVSSANLPKDRSSYPLNIYARLFIPYFVPEAADKVLYMDADMIVLSDLYALWQTDITDYSLAAVADARVSTFDNHWGGILNYKALGLNGKSRYFNTGVLLINSRKWQENNITQQILDIVSNNIKYANYPDQYGLNIVLADRWLELDSRWNHFAAMPHEFPYVIHFVDRKPIYHSYKNSKAYKDYFYKHLNDTAWRNTKQIGEAERNWKKVKNILSKLFR